MLVWENGTQKSTLLLLLSDFMKILHFSFQESSSADLYFTLMFTSLCLLAVDSGGNLIKICYDFQQEGTVVPYDKFNAEQDAEVLNKAVKGLGRKSYMFVSLSLSLSLSLFLCLALCLCLSHPLSLI